MAQSQASQSQEASSTESETSEDDEEARKIREAICDESLFAKKGGNGNSKTSNCSTASNITDGRSSNLPKSKRYQDKNDDNDDNILHTTPEFRAYVAKQLTQLLDKQLAAALVNSAWVEPKRRTPLKSGIKLLSDSTTQLISDYGQSSSLCSSPSPNVPSNSHSVAIKSKHAPKRRLSTSSDSSDDETIKACVFSVTDIARENEMLASLEKKTQEANADEQPVIAKLNCKDVAIANHGSSGVTNKSEEKGKKKKKKKKKKKLKEKGIT